MLGIYSGRGWAFIEEHLHDVLGKQSKGGGDLAAAVRHFMAMLRCEQNSLHCQRLYLSQFMDAVQEAEAQLVGGGGWPGWAFACLCGRWWWAGWMGGWVGGWGAACGRGMQ